MATGTAILNIVFELRFITKCYDIITIYHLPILSTAARDFSRMSPLRGTNPNAVLYLDTHHSKELIEMS